jgi:hypothetical protein
MNDAVPIRRRSGALRANHHRFQPSFLQPPPVDLPDLRISNREPLRLEIPVTQRKQTTDRHSNRDDNACFSNLVRAVNRLCDCGAIDSAPRNRVRADDSARRNTAQSSKINSQEQSIPPGNHRTNSKNVMPHPSFLFRLKPTPTVCLLQFTNDFNRTMFRLRRNSSEPPAAALALPARSLSRGTIFAAHGPRYPIPLMPQRSDFKRRSKRLGLRVPVRIYGRTADDRPFRDMTETLHVNAFGARIELGKLLTPGQTVLVVHGITEEEKECRVVDVRPNRTGKWKVGLAFVKPEGNFWHIFQPLERVSARGNDHVE